MGKIFFYFLIPIRTDSQQFGSTEGFSGNFHREQGLSQHNRKSHKSERTRRAQRSVATAC